MKNIGFLALIASLLAGAPAMAATLCPSAATPGGFSNTITDVPGPLDGTCGTDSAVNLNIANDTSGYAKLEWTPSVTNFPPGLTLGNLTGLDINESFSADVPSDQPYYQLAFNDPSDSVGQGSVSDQILLIEFQSTTISGSDMPMSSTSTLFNLYDNTTGMYLEGGQSDTETLAGWLASDPSLSSDAITGLRVAIGLGGGCSGPCSENLLVNSLTVNDSLTSMTTTTPEPSSLLLLGTGLVGLAGIARRKLGWA